VFVEIMDHMASSASYVDRICVALACKTTARYAMSKPTYLCTPTPDLDDRAICEGILEQGYDIPRSPYWYQSILSEETWRGLFRAELARRVQVLGRLKWLKSLEWWDWWQGRERLQWLERLKRFGWLIALEELEWRAIEALCLLRQEDIQDPATNTPRRMAQSDDHDDHDDDNDDNNDDHDGGSHPPPAKRARKVGKYGGGQECDLTGPTTNHLGTQRSTRLCNPTICPISGPI
jgi:hypothetical protein